MLYINYQNISGRYVSGLGEIKHHVLRGSVLVFFIIHLNDLPIDIKKAETVFVAGDANILTEDTNEDILITK